MTDIADVLAEWIESLEEGWSLGDAVVSWARAYGDDFEGAWVDCHRADFLVALGALAGLDTVVLRRHTCAVAREAVELSPAHRAALEPLVLAAEAWTRGESAASASSYKEVLDGIRAASDAIDADERRRADGLEARLDDMVAMISRLPMDRAERLLAESFAPTGDLAALRALHVGRHDRAATSFVMRVLLAALVYAELADSVAADRALVAQNDRRHGTKVLREAVERIGAAEGLLAGVAAGLFRDAARARAWLRSGSEEVWREALLEIARVSSDDTEERTPLEVVETVVVHRMEERSSEVLARYADALRADIPLESLVSSDDDDDEPEDDALDIDDAPAMVIERDTMLAAFEKLRGLATVIDPELLEAVDVVLIALRAPGAIERPALVPLVANVQSRLAKVFHAEAQRSTGKEGAQWAAMGKRVEREMRAYREWLAKKPLEEMD